ncbi:NUDIX hydrolase [candidate division WS5 bacterium]|uniref:NUDIX hydrolase n=1 Tax=candidate division WS5 bacterium TaxID=2093353 RepID=A0A419DB35_9BACT|nr:MAG: NUDIX hydrolase [candidate division WS5 bacterium]
MAKEIQKTTVKGLFERDDKILLVKDQKGFWELPGGRINHGEDPEEALQRELNEELGWSQVSIKDIIDSWSFTSTVGDIHYQFIVLTYACITNEEKIKKNDEYTEYRWVPVLEIDSLTMREGYKKTIKQFLTKG